jgi:hypothetical protein
MRSVSPTYVQIKQDIKALLLMTRVPRSLDIFFYFLWCYRKQQTLLNAPVMKAASIGKLQPHKNKKTTNTASIGWSLRRKQIELLAPSTEVIKNKLGVHTKDYDKYFDAFVIWKCKTSSSFQGRARTINGWTSGAENLFNKYADLKIPSYIERLFHHQTRDTTNTASIGWSLSKPFYYRTKKSYRWYHPDQNISTAEKKKIFRGCFNIDIVSCFSSIWWHELGGYDCELENAQWLNPEHKDYFLSIIKRDFHVYDDERAKRIRSKLFSKKRHHTEKTGVIWYDNLREHIIEKATSWGEHNLPEDIMLTVHNVFTYLEWQVVERCLQAGKEALLIHDGIIFSELDVKKAAYLASPHKLKVEKW